MTTYERYHIPTHPAPNAAPHPSRFQVKVSRIRLAKLLIQELLHFRGNLPVVLSRPCVYGVFSGPIGGFAPRQRKCVGCLRCTVQYPDIVQIHHNPERLVLGDAFFGPDQVDTLLYEAATGRVPVRGAGYRGAYGGTGWDSMWTDMSEIVRPTRDGIHGREFISTSVDLGARPRFLEFDDWGQPRGETPRLISVSIPMLLDNPVPAVARPELLRAFGAAAAKAQTLAVMPVERMLRHGLAGSGYLPLAEPEQVDSLGALEPAPTMVEVNGWDAGAYRRAIELLPGAVVCVRVPFGDRAHQALEAGVGCLHLTADYHGGTERGFVMRAIRELHSQLVDAGRRQQVTLIGSGGIIAAEHVPKALICGLDCVALDTAAWIALQARFDGECRQPTSARVVMPPVDESWAAQRLINLLGSWHDQLLEILGAMGLREVRRLRGEFGRAMFQADLEREAFAEIEGFGGD